MAPYDVRDRIGHFVRPRSAEGQPCQHACCRGYRVHPSNKPIVYPAREMRRASDDELAQSFVKASRSDSAVNERARDRILHEMERRDRVAAERSRRREAVAAGRAARAMERESETERIYLAAEAYTRGNWVNARGRAAGIADREILSGRQVVFDRYASEEAREFFGQQARPTAAYWRGEDTRAAGIYTTRPRRRAPARSLATGWTRGGAPQRAPRGLGWSKAS